MPREISHESRAEKERGTQKTKEMPKVRYYILINRIYIIAPKKTKKDVDKANAVW